VSCELQEQIEFQLEQLNRLLQIYHSLVESSRSKPPDDIEMASLGALLHSFYSGVENIFARIARELDTERPHADSWHADLLEAMTVPSEHRPAVITPELGRQLRGYLQFRHVFRSAYVFTLRWDKMAPLAEQCEPVFRSLESQLRAFLQAIEK